MGNLRIANVLWWCGFGGFIVIATYCVIGGKVGDSLLAIYAYTIIRNTAVILIYRRPFILEGRPLPASLYLAPCPAPPGVWKYLQLYVFPIGLGLIVWVLGSEQVVSPITNYAYIWATVGISAFLHFIYATIIISQELTCPHFGSLTESAPFGSYLMAFVGILEWAAIVGVVSAILIGLLKI